ncbi:hypothetical protein ACTPOE_16905 [Castellaniella sp. WN]
MTINTQKLRDLVTFDFELPVSVRDAVDDACDHIDAQTAEIARLRDALLRLERGFQAGRDNADEMFRGSGNVYHDGRRVAYDQAAADVRAALSGESKC